MAIPTFKVGNSGSKKSVLDMKQTLQIGLTDYFLTKSWPTYDGKTLDRNGFVTASEAMRCDRRLYFQKTHSVPVEPGIGGSTGIFIRGHMVEAALVDALIAGLPEDWEVHDAADLQVSYYSEELAMSGTPDGYLLHKPSGLVHPIEIKSTHPNKNLESMTDATPAHKLQLRINAFLMADCWLREPQHVPAGFKNFAHIGFVIYADCNDMHRLRVFEVPIFTRPEYLQADWPSDLQAAAQKAQNIMYMIEEGAPEDSFQASGILTGECKYCDFANSCKARNARGSAIPAAVAGAGAGVFGGGRMAGKSMPTQAQIAQMAKTTTMFPTVNPNPIGAVASGLLNQINIGIAPRGATPDPKKQRQTELLLLLGDFAELQATKNEATAAYENCKELVKEAIRTDGDDGTLTVGRYTATLTPVNGRETWDTPALKATLGDDEAKKYLKYGKPSLRLDFKVDD